MQIISKFTVEIVRGVYKPFDILLWYSYQNEIPLDYFNAYSIRLWNFLLFPSSLKGALSYCINHTFQLYFFIEDSIVLAKLKKAK